MTATAPYGSWASPLTAVTATAEIGVGQVAAPFSVGVIGEEVWWQEARPQEAGRSDLIRRRADASVASALPAPWDLRTRFLEYGGRAWAGVTGEDGPLIVFVHFPDQRLYVHEPDAPGARPRPLTPTSPVGGGLRWAEPVIDLPRGVVRCAMEEFTGEGPQDVRRLIVAVPLDGSAAEDRTAVRELSDDRHRFVTGAQVSPDGTRAVWLAWDHPHMPWDAAELKIAEVGQDGVLRDTRKLLGGPGDPVAQAEWTPAGELLVALARSGWWNLYRVDPASGQTVALHTAEEEFAGPQAGGRRWFAPLPDGRVAVLHGVGPQRLGVLDPSTGELHDVPEEYADWRSNLVVRGTRVYGVAAGPTTSSQVLEIETAGAEPRVRVVGAEHRDRVPQAYLPELNRRIFTGADGRQVHANVHAPRNPDFTGPDTELPPYVIWAHGGPTMRPPIALNLEIAYFTSRGIGVAEVDYGGTPGYGKAHTERLRGQWGVVDVEDCAAVATALVDEEIAAPGRLAIRGGSAGGFTSAASIVATGIYACAYLYCPVLDLELFAAGGTHDFEAHFLDTLLGPPNDFRDRYRDRSPINHLDLITVPFLITQGAADPICPPEQSEALLAGMAGRGIPHASLVFEGEGHGFRRQESLVASLEAELGLYAQVFGFETPGVPVLELKD